MIDERAGSADEVRDRAGEQAFDFLAEGEEVRIAVGEGEPAGELREAWSHSAGRSDGEDLFAVHSE